MGLQLHHNCRIDGQCAVPLLQQTRFALGFAWPSCCVCSQRGRTWLYSRRPHMKSNANHGGISSCAYSSRM